MKTLNLNYPNPDIIERIHDLIGYSPILVHNYRQAKVALAFDDDAELIARVANTPNRLDKGYSQEGDAISWYAINPHWVMSNGNKLVKLAGQCVCVVPEH